MFLFRFSKRKERENIWRTAHNFSDSSQDTLGKAGFVKSSCHIYHAFVYHLFEIILVFFPQTRLNKIISMILFGHHPTPFIPSQPFLKRVKNVVKHHRFLVSTISSQTVTMNFQACRLGVF